ncbi:MAG: molybdopterin-dependent oxidoreductase [Chloroflexi bacterium]|nr:molybdopterin-dependent oxidoreductase [Chloroflexota bacterium]
MSDDELAGLKIASKLSQAPFLHFAQIEVSQMNDQPSAQSTGTQVITTACVHDCGGRCILKAHVRDGVVVNITTDDGPEPQLRACLRGRAYRQRLYSPDRLKYPLKRTGERGKGAFTRISWDEALDTVAGEVQRLRSRWGSEAIFCLDGPGNISQLHSTAGGALNRFFNMSGGCLARRGSQSYGAANAANHYTYGSVNAGNHPADLVNSRLIILWSSNRAETIEGTNACHYLAQAKRKGIRIVCVDPRLTDTAAAFADQWIPIRPATDAAMLIAMAYVMIQENLHDRQFLDRYTLGFDAFADYVLGRTDGIPKTPAWAEDITGVPAERTAALAREYATTRPAALVPGGGMQRTACGEQSIRASITLACMTGNVGLSGGHPGGHHSTVFPAPDFVGHIPVPANPLGVSLSVNNWAEGVLKGRAEGWPADVKMLYVVGRNPLNQCANVNKMIAALRKLDFLVVHEQFMTATARFADVVLPVTTWLERCDITLAREYALYMNKVVEPMYECKSDLEIFTELAKRLGLEGFNDKTEEQWLEGFVQDGEIEDYREFRRKGIHRFRQPEPVVYFQEQIADPENHPFATPSGKIEIYSQRLADMNRPDVIPPIPRYVEPWEGPNDPLSARFPLQLITPQSKRRAHSTYAGLPWLEEIDVHSLWINPVDAAARGIAPGDRVKVFNDRGETRLPAKVTERIMPGVVSISEGAPYNPDAWGIDQGGSANVLTRDAATPIGEGATLHSCLVQISRCGVL